MLYLHHKNKTYCFRNNASNWLNSCFCQISPSKFAATFALIATSVFLSKLFLNVDIGVYQLYMVLAWFVTYSFNPLKTSPEYTRAGVYENCVL